MRVTPAQRIPTPPGIILQREFLEPLEITQRALATHLKIPVRLVNEIIKGKRGIAPETAWLLADAFGTSPEFWSNLQTTHDLSLHRPKTHVVSLVPVQS
ncbi:MAG: HigA family addiction module antidote protein [Candidatus Hydrogenedentes bacterium]|nr:HigA family addiction module antidote protein [Candidatus Hydrogenedentota bacterium]